MYCRVKDIDIYYEIAGEGFPVLIVHGFSPDHRLMEGCLEPVFEKKPGWKRIYLDLPGMGQTKSADWLVNSDQVLDLLFEFSERFIPAPQPFVVIGESYGGLLARAFVKKQPDRVAGLCLICPSIKPEEAKNPRPVMQTLVHDEKLIAGLSAEDAAEYVPMAVVQSPKTWQRFRDEILVGLKLADQAHLERFRKGGYWPKLSVDDLERPFEKPALFLLGRQDASVGYRDGWDLLDKYPRASYVVLDLAGHNLQIDQESLFTALVAEWLDRVKLT